MTSILTRTQKAAKARKLEAQGLSRREIARRMGYRGTKSVVDLLNPELARERMRRDNARRAGAKRAWAEENDRAACPQCGDPMAVGAKRKGAEGCRQCRIKNEAERVAERGARIVAWWAEGLTVREISRELGWSSKHVGVEIHRLRGKGFDLPYRHPLKTAAK